MTDERSTSGESFQRVWNERIQRAERERDEWKAGAFKFDEERRRLEAALRMLWDNYLLVITDEQKAHVIAALEPEGEKHVLNPPPNYSSQDQSPPPWGRSVGGTRG